MQTSTLPIATKTERQIPLRYDLQARRYRQGATVFYSGDRLEIEVAPDIWLPVSIRSGSEYTDDGWIFLTQTGLPIVPQEGLRIRRPDSFQQ